MPKLPSPCIDVCKFKREGHCIGCSMTKAQKKLFKELKTNKSREAFVGLITTQQASMGAYAGWVTAYQKKRRKKGWPPST